MADQLNSVWLAPAKLNLFLHVLGRRPDGYHRLQTVFQFLDYHDELEFELRSDAQIRLIDSSSIPYDQNIIVKAAQKLQSLSADPKGVDIRLRKKIPLGAGLGGGSSNAATTLIALNQLWELFLSTQQLTQIGLQLGADLPIFLSGHASWAEGIGDQLTPIPLEEPWYIVLAMPFPIATGKIFSDPELTAQTSPITIQEFLRNPLGTRNDCESVVCKRYPEVAQALKWLNQFAHARLTGTGGSLFATCLNQDQAYAIAEQVPKPYKAFVAKGMNESPCLNGVSPSGKARGFDPRIPRFES